MVKGVRGREGGGRRGVKRQFVKDVKARRAVRQQGASNATKQRRFQNVQDARGVVCAGACLAYDQRPVQEQSGIILW